MLGSSRYRSIVASALLIAGAVVASCVPSEAQTIKEIVAKKKISIGVMTGIPPYDTVDTSGKTIGYNVDLANLIGKYLGVEVEIVPVNNSSRIAALESGKIDVQIALATATPERAKVVMFTSPYGSYDMSLIGAKTANIKKVDDLAGKKVSVPKGSTQDLTISAFNFPGMQVVRFDDDATAMQALVSGQVDATAAPAVMANDLLKKNGLERLEVKTPIYSQYQSMAVRMGSFELLQWLNNFIFYIRTDGQLDALHKKWTGVPVPNQPLPSF
ncbi:transporter substrate-binding domain-containing protein [Microvirga pudoricolor]|uniref:transporter substrate-binding domain-containing protein n=1 Tax=Microvirga pudoricolor TaxID=2778729 RepID=UPI0019511DE1|nr:transporter substrate-binding domain-containing protein [Microvirga pudoricolor]MBM6595101.1 transporter substrate-binding domain-containing protein [Microvirga pudoricolor]